MTLTLLPDRFDTEGEYGSPYTARQQSMGSSQREKAHGECRRFKPRATVPELLPTRPARNVQVATSLYTLDHNQQDCTKFIGTQTRQAVQEHIS